MADPKKDQIRKAAEADLLTFIRLVAPHRVLGQCHEDLIQWWNRPDHKQHQLALLPRDHQKSALMGYRVAWTITKEPDTTFLYISATTTLAEKQVKFIQDILLSPVYRRYWPEMVNEQEAKREKWTAREFSIDHPKRKLEFVRDPTVFAAGLDTNLTGLHFKRAILDDVVVKENAYTEEGRNKVAFAYSLLASIESTDSEEWVVGTRYHPADLYNELITMEFAVYDEHGHEIGSEFMYEVYEKVLEDSVERDGTGQYLWPKQRRHDGRYFGFDIKERSKKYAKYIDKGQFFAQYYNDPTDPTNLRLARDRFQYYDQAHIRLFNGDWYFKGRRLNILGALDLAFSESKRADYTAIVVAGIDEDNNIYILYIDRFKTSKASVIFDHLLDAHNKWYFRRLRAETVSGQEMIVGELKNYMKEYGVYFSIDEFSPTRHEGSKAERIAMTLLPRYDAMAIWHFRGGHCQTLEDELVVEHPEHDDIADAFTSVVMALRAPSRNTRRQRENHKPAVNARFGGVAH